MKPLPALLALAIASVATPAHAELEPGTKAPDFTAEGALAGKPFDFRLSDALKSGPVVVYFFPAAFTPGCTLEAKLFADAADEFKAEGATLIGVTRGNTDQLAEFSTEVCRSKFPVASISQTTMRAYKASMTFRPGWTDRVSYVIAPDGKIKLAYSSLSPDKHVEKSLAAVHALKTGK